MADDFAFSFALDDPIPPKRVPLYRMRRVDPGGRVVRFYTASADERRAVAASDGFEVETVTGIVYDGPAPGTRPLARLWHHPSRVHSYTVVPENLSAALARGTYRHEGAVAHVFATNGEPGTVPLHALVHRPTNAHLYTVDPAERDAELAAGYEALGVACWVHPADAGG